MICECSRAFAALVGSKKPSRSLISGAGFLAADCRLKGVDLHSSRSTAGAETMKRPATTSTTSWLAAAAAGMVVSGGLVAAQSAPDGENGRYSMTPIPEGVLRLDTRTGTVSTCTKNGAGWACYAVPDERTALDAEIGRLQAEVEKLKGQLAAGPPVSGKIDEALPKSDQLKKAEPKVAEGERKIEIPLPSDKDVDRVMSFLEKAWRRLIDMANRVQKDVSGKI
ncbi:hypothetical protein AB7M16_003210 [Bradyrhizobium sp. USDA 372]